MGFDFSSLSPWIGPASTLIGLLGGSGQPNPANDPNYQNAQKYLGLQQALSGQYGNQANAAGDEYSSYNPQYLGAVNDEANYLRQPVGTDAQDAAYLAKATSGSAAAYARANANLTASLASRGITDSSEMAGGLTGNADALAAQQAGAQNDLAAHNIAQRQSNMNALIGLLGGVANTEYGRQQSAMGQEGNLDKSIYGEDMSQANQDLGLQQQASAQRSGLLSTLGGGISDALSANDANPLQDAQEAALYHSAGYVKNGDGDWVPGPTPSAPPMIAPSAVPPVSSAPPVTVSGGFGSGAAPGGGFGSGQTNGSGFGGTLQPLSAFLPPTSESVSPAPAAPSAPSVPTPTWNPQAGTAQAAPASAFPGVSLVKHPMGQAFAKSGVVITGDQADALGIPSKGKKGAPGYDADGDLITSD